MELQQQQAASGFNYSSGPITVRGKGDDLIIENGAMAPLKCHAREEQHAN
jgi:membrane-bound inhibitor of C-type lysozyme